ncbi:MAG: AI-2E family transporter [Chloroflexota bacterium]
MRLPTPAATTQPPRPAPTPEPAPVPERRPGLTPVTLLLTLFVAYMLYQVQLLLVLVALSLVFATIIDRPVSLLERRKVPRPLGILLVYVALIGVVALLFSALAPVIREQAQIFREQAPGQLAALRDAWAASSNAILNGPGADALTQAIRFIDNPGSGAGGGALPIPFPSDAAIGFITGIGGGIVSILTVLVISFYYLTEKTWLRRLVIYELPAEKRVRAARIWDNVEGKVGDWLRGQLILCLVIGLVATTGYGLLEVRFWPLLGLWAGLTEIIPILGPWLGAIPAFIIALTQGWDKALLVALFAAGLQLLENTVLVPRVMRGAVGLSPMTVFLAILAGTQFLGISGAILAIPFAAAIQVVLSEWLESRREAGRAGAAPGWRWMRGSGSASATGAAAQATSSTPPAPAPGQGHVQDPGDTPASRRWSHEALGRLRDSRSGRGEDPRGH